MKNITRGLLLATAVVCFGLVVQPSASARINAKQLQPSAIDDDGLDPLNVGGNDDNVVVPEPGTLILLGTGLAGLAAARRKRKNR